MKLESLVSVIIPTYNRVGLIGATLDSIITQKYKNWECIVVDDGSDDHTPELMEFYCELDSRIRYLQRPPTYPKGANSCRNFGLEKSRGEFIQFFDSDDLMVPHFLDTKVRTLVENHVDYVISKTINFQDPETLKIIHKNEKYYEFEKFKFSNFNYVVQNFNWLTPDFFAKRGLIESLGFNVKLSSSQERNFFSKITALSTNAYIIDDYLTYRRVHSNSTQSTLQKSDQKRKKSYFEFCFYTYFDLKKINRKQAYTFLLKDAIDYAMDNFVGWRKNKKLWQEIVIKNIHSGLWFALYQISMFVLNKGHFFRRRFKDIWSPDLIPIGYLKRTAKKDTPLINILTRTSSRPNYFRKCRDSIENQSYVNLKHIVSYDDTVDLSYLTDNEIDLINVTSLRGRNSYNQKSYNLYCNSLLDSVTSGWILFLDDDNVLIEKNVLEILASQAKYFDEDTLFIFQTEFPDKTKIPQSDILKKRRIEEYQIDTSCVLFHSKYKSEVKWDNQRMADFRFIKRIAKIIPNHRWIELVVSKKLNFGDSGNRNDIQEF